MMITTKEVNELIEMIQICKTGATAKRSLRGGSSTYIKGVSLDSFLFVMDKAIGMLKEF